MNQPSLQQLNPCESIKVQHPLIDVELMAKRVSYDETGQKAHFGPIVNRNGWWNRDVAVDDKTGFVDGGGARMSRKLTSYLSIKKSHYCGGFLK